MAFTSRSSILDPSDTNEREDVFVRDSVTGIITRISAEGRYITLESSAPSLVPDDTNGVSDIFLWDRAG